MLQSTFRDADNHLAIIRTGKKVKRIENDIFVFDGIENIVAKGENADYQHPILP